VRDVRADDLQQLLIVGIHSSDKILIGFPFAYSNVLQKRIVLTQPDEDDEVSKAAPNTTAPDVAFDASVATTIADKIYYQFIIGIHVF